MRSVSIALSLLLSLLLSIFVPSLAAAGEDGDPNLAEAACHFKAGSTAFDIANFAKALREFQAAAALKPAPQLDYNIGECHEELGQLKEAIADYERFLAAAPDDPDAKRVREHVAVLKARLAPPPPAPTLAPSLVAPPPAAIAATPVYERWWLWTILGVAVVGAGLGLGLGLGLNSNHVPDSSLGSMTVSFQ